MPRAQSTSPDELMRLEVAAQTRWTLLALWFSIQPERVRHVLKRVALIALIVLAASAMIAYLIIRPLHRGVGEGVLVTEGALLAIVAFVLTRPPGREIAGILAAAREHYTAQAQGRITTEDAAEHLGIELGIPLARSGGRLIGIDHKAQQHILVCAPTRAGKGLHLTTVLLTYPNSALVIDPKSEQYARTSGFRAQQGQIVYCIPGNSLDLSQFYDLCDGDDAAALHRQFLRPPPMSSDNAIFYFKSVPLFQAIGHYARVHRRNPIRALVAAGMQYAAEVPANTQVYLQAPRVGVPPTQGHGRKRTRLQVLSKRAPREARALLRDPRTEWTRAQVRHVERGLLEADFAVWPVWTLTAEMQVRAEWLVMRRDLDGRLTYVLLNAPATTPRTDLIAWSCQRFWTERTYQDAKSELGWDDFAARKYRAREHHMALTASALWFIAQTKWHWHQRYARDPELLRQFELEILPRLSTANVREMLQAVLPLPQLTPDQARRVVVEHLVNRARSTSSRLKAQRAAQEGQDPSEPEHVDSS